MIRILPRYLLRETLVPTTLSLITLTFILLIQVLFTRADEFAGAFSFGLLVRLVSYFVPSLWILAVPMSVLIGVLLGVGRMTVDNEIKAMRTHGVNMLGIFLPTLVFGVLLTVGCLYNSLYLAPAMLAKFNNVIESIRTELVHSMEPGRFEDRFRTKDTNMVMYFDKKDPETGEMKNVYVSIEGTPKGMDDKAVKKTPAIEADTMRTLVLAASGKMVTADKKSDVEDVLVKSDASTSDTVKLVLYNGTIHAMRGRQDPRYTVGKFEVLTQSLLMKSDRSSDDMAPSMTVTELRQAIRKAQKSEAAGATTVRRKGHTLSSLFRAELYQRISFALATFCFVLIGLPLAIYVKPSGKASGIGIAFGLIMAYYGFMHYGVVLTRQVAAGHSAFFGTFMIFLPNIVLALLGLIMMRATIRR